MQVHVYKERVQYYDYKIIIFEVDVYIFVVPINRCVLTHGAIKGPLLLLL